MFTTASLMYLRRQQLRSVASLELGMVQACRTLHYQALDPWKLNVKGVEPALPNRSAHWLPVMHAQPRACRYLSGTGRDTIHRPSGHHQPWQGQWRLFCTLGTWGNRGVQTGCQQAFQLPCGAQACALVSNDDVALVCGLYGRPARALACAFVCKTQATWLRAVVLQAGHTSVVQPACLCGAEHASHE